MPFKKRKLFSRWFKVINYMYIFIKKKFNNNLFHDIEDVYDRKNSQRQFYTMPSTTIPNNRDTFQKWLYKTPKTCKEGNGNQCVANNHTPLRNTHSQFYT